MFLNLFFLFFIYGFINSQEPESAQILINHVINSIKNAQNSISKLDTSVLNLSGMSSSKGRHLLNNLCNKKGINYLEIGVWKGSTFVSALYKNKENIKSAVAMDNWSQFKGPKKEFLDNVKNFLKYPIKFYECDCFKFDLNNIKNKIDIYFYDGNHSYDSQKRAFTYFSPIFNDTFIAIVDDYNWPNVHAGTQDAIKELKYNVLFEKHLPSVKPSDKQNWWNGMYIAVLQKTS